MIDVEDLLASIEELLKDKLNLKIAAVEAEKAAKGLALSPTLAPVLSTSYFLQTWNNRILNVSPAIYYGVETIEAIDGGQAIAQRFKIFVEIILLDNGMNPDVMKRVLRYARAIKEVFEETFKDHIFQDRMKVETVRPEAFKLEQDSSEEIKVGGILVTTTLF